MIATNMEQLEAAFQKLLMTAAEIAAENINNTMKKEMAGFYTKGKPKIYERLGYLGETSRVSEIKSDGTSAEFDAYLDQSHIYTTGTWSMAKVQENAEEGTGGILGKSGFWARIEAKIPKDLSAACKKVF